MKKVFVIGDSISLHYGPFLERYIRGFLKYDRKGYNEEIGDINNFGAANGGDSKQVLEYIQENPGLEYDVLVLNCGLHDIRIWDGKIQIDADSYESNLRKIIASQLEKGKRIIWVTSTPIDDALHNTLSPTCHRHDRDVVRYNEIALKIMNENQIPVIDLYGFTKNLDISLYEDHAHFLVPVRQLQAAFIAGNLLALEV